jgi:hypothetical protein
MEEHDAPNDEQPVSLKRRRLCTGALGLAAAGPLGLAGCGGADGVAGDGAQTAVLTSSGGGMAVAARVFTHPGLLHTEADFTRMRTKIAAGAQPWVDGWNALTSSGRAHLNADPRPLETVIRGGTGQNSAQMYIDIARTYQLALRWKISGDVAYANRAVEFLNAWSSTMKVLTGNADRFLAAGIYGYQWANAAEIMRGYGGWAAADVARFQALLLDLFYPLCNQFLTGHNDAHITNYWANWDQCTIAGILAIGVFCDREDLYNQAIEYYKHGEGNGANHKATYYLHPGYLGQWQESGRDQGHCTLGIALGAAFCEMAWNQGDDMYGYDNNRFLAGAEYVAKSNLTDASGAFYSVPFTPYRNVHAYQTALSSAGQGSLRPTWEMVQHHYMNRKGLATPWSALQAALNRPEGDGTNGDQLGFGTLTFTRDPAPANGKPSGLSAVCSQGEVQLSWWGAAHATSYTVKRATVSGGPYTTVASGVRDLLTWTDRGRPAGAYFYVVTAQGPGGESAASNQVRVVVGTALHTRLALDQTSGTSATDSSGNGRHGTVAGATWTTGRSGGALRFDGVDDYVALPANLLAGLADFTISAWVYWDAARNWARIFDFGGGADTYMMLTPRSGAGVLRFAITVNHGIGEQAIVAAQALPVGRWAHVAVTLRGSTGTLYLDGVAVGSNTAMALAPWRLGWTGQNWLGRSQYPTDPYFNGRIDELRIYHGAMSAAEVAALAAA